MTELSTLNEARNNIIKYKMLSTAYPDNEKYKQRLDLANKRLEEHPLNTAVKNGFINSISTDIMASGETMEGLTKDIDRMPRFIVEDDKGNLNYLGDVISKVGRYGVSAEDFLIPFVKAFNKFGATKEFSKVLAESILNIKRLKSDKDVAGYLHNYVLSPNSEFVKMGTWINDITDLTAKETYYRHLIDTGVPHKKAVTTVIKAFPDYKENMPPEVKVLSDYAVLMFPSYWMRIQKIIYNMARQKTLNLSLQLELESMLGSQLGEGFLQSFVSENIIDANLYNKFTDFGGIVHSPIDLATTDSLLLF